MSEDVDEELDRLKKEKMEELMAEGEGQEHPESPLRLTDSNFQETIEKYPFVVVDFWAEWCSPCKAMEPVIEQFASEFSGRAVFGKMNVDQNQRTPGKFGIAGIPTLLFFKNGELVDKKVGLARGPELKQKIEKHLD